MKKKRAKTTGEVIKVFSGGKFKIELKNGDTIRAYLCGKMRQNKIRVLPGDNVTVELSNYDNKGRVIYRNT